MTDTKLNINEIEVLIASYPRFSYLKHIVVPNVCGGFLLDYEADLLVLNDKGFLTEIEIKRSWSDFLADFKKKNFHSDDRTKRMYYAVPLSISKKVLDFLNGCVNDFEMIPKIGIITYDDNKEIRILKEALNLRWNPRKLFLEEQLKLARLGCIRTWNLKRREIK